MSHSTVPLIMKIMASSLCAANRAGIIIRDIMTKGNLNIVEKGVNDLQTEADRTVQQSIVASLMKQFPQVSIIGEEGNIDSDVSPELLVLNSDEHFLKLNCPNYLIEAKDEDIVIWVDPLDGTSEYTEGFLENVTVLIGISFQSNSVGGIIHQPYYKHESGELGRTLWGLKGLGIGGIKSQAPPKDEFIITTTRSRSNSTVQSTIEALSPTKILRVGGAGFKILQILEGKAHAYVYPRPGIKKWDTCCIEAVLEADGGKLTDILGDHYKYDKNVEHINRRGVVATCKNINHCDLLSKIPDDVKQEILSSS